MCIHAEEDIEREKERPGARTKKRERRGRRLTACSNKGESATCTSAAHNALLLVPPRSLAHSFVLLPFSHSLPLPLPLLLLLLLFPPPTIPDALFSTLILLSFCRCYTPCRLHPGGTSCCQVCGTDLPPLFFSPLCPPLALPCVTRDLLTATRSFYVGHPVVHLTTVESGERGGGRDDANDTHCKQSANSNMFSMEPTRSDCWDSIGTGNENY